MSGERCYPITAYLTREEYGRVMSVVREGNQYRYGSHLARAAILAELERIEREETQKEETGHEH